VDPKNGSLLKKLKTNSGPIATVAFSPDNAYIVAACYGCTIQSGIKTVRTHLKTLVGHSEAVKSAAFSPDGAHIVTASADHTIKVWDCLLMFKMLEMD